MTPEQIDDLIDFANGRIREEPEVRALALYGLLHETIRPFIGGRGVVHRNAAHALRLFVSQWGRHPDYRRDWVP